MEYASYSEAPPHMHFWCGVSAIAGALRRKVWLDQKYFKWYCNCYIVLVAPPGIVSKSTTAAIAIDLLRKVPGIKFGPDVVTWPALVQAFAESTETFAIDEDHHAMSAITLESSEMGNLIKPNDPDMIDLMVSLWDGKQGNFQKMTKHSGSDKVENPWINMIACTTPSWIAGNFPEYMIGGGFTSRCIFVYAEEKDKYVPYVDEVVPEGQELVKAKLIQDLEHISMSLCGPYSLTADARDFGRAWYMKHYESRPVDLDASRFGGYIARKQTHIHKLAMILQASKTDSLVIELDTLQTAEQMVTDLEEDMPFVFNKIGRSDESFHVERLIEFLKRKGRCSVSEAYAYVHANFPSARDFQDALDGCIRSGQIVSRMEQQGPFLYPIFPPAKETD